MKTGINEALLLSLVMGAVIFICRVFPFLFFRTKKPGGKESGFLAFVEKSVPPAAMTVLAFNSITVPFRENPREGTVVLAASALTAALHLIRRNPLISIFGGTAAYFLLEKLIMR